MNDRESKIADYAHSAWSGWMKYMFGKSVHNDDGTITIPSWAVSRWTLQMNTSYKDLPEDMKESDREEARRIASLSPPDFRIEIDCEELLNAVQMAYRKHHMGDDSIGWNELSDLLHDALFNAMGPNKLEEWREAVDK